MDVGSVVLVPRWSLREGEGLVQQVFRGAQRRLVRLVGRELQF
jgi:hypothetical protein